MKSVCSKAKCKTSDGKKPTMILCARSKQQTAKRVLFESDLSEDDSSDEYQSSNYSESDVEMPDESQLNKQLKPMDISECKVGMWVKVVYEGEIFIGKVQGRQNLAVEVQCLEHPFGIRQHQNMEKDSVHYNEVFHCDDCKPKLEKVGRTWKWTY